MTGGFSGGSKHFEKLMHMVNKLQAVCALIGDNAEAGSDGKSGLWDTLPIIVAVGGQVRPAARRGGRASGP